MVRTGDGSRRSSGYVVADDRVITTKHGVLDENGRPLRNLLIGLVEGRDFVWKPATVGYFSETFDVAILVCPALRATTLGKVTPTKLGRREHAKGIAHGMAFPTFNDDRERRHPRRTSIEGPCNPDEMLPSPQLLVTVVRGIPISRQGWGGASGAGLFFDGKLVAIVARQELTIEKHCLTAIPLEEVFADPEFWTAYGADQESVLLGGQAVEKLRGLDAAHLMPSRWLYMHYLDPELQRVVNAEATLSSLRDVMTTQLATTYGILYSPVSFAWESHALSDRELAAEMGDSGQFVYLSKYRSFGEYIESRVEFYSGSQDIRRIYTSSEVDRLDDVFSKYIREKVANTTEIVSDGLIQWAANFSPELLDYMIRCLSERSGAGVTLDYFKSQGIQEKFGQRITAALDLQITKLFTRVYLNEVDGDIFTSVPQYHWVDSEARSAPFFDWVMLDNICRRILPNLYAPSTSLVPHMRSLLEIRGGATHVSFCEKLFGFVEIIVGLSEEHPSLSSRVTWLQKNAYRYFPDVRPEAGSEPSDYDRLFRRATDAAESALHGLRREIHI